VWKTAELVPEKYPTTSTLPLSSSSKAMAVALAVAPVPTVTICVSQFLTPVLPTWVTTTPVLSGVLPMRKEPPR